MHPSLWRFLTVLVISKAAPHNDTMHKAFILGAGLGTRLRPLTLARPKPLVPVFHRPLTEHALDHCRAAGLTDFAINTHYLPEKWSELFPGNQYLDSQIEFFHEPILLETGGGLKNIQSFIGDDHILVYNGDLLTNLDIKKLIAQHEQSGDVVTLGLRSSGPKTNIAVEKGRVVDLRHERGIHPGTHQFTGIYCVSSEILRLIPADEKIAVIPAFLELAKQNKIGACVLDEGHWLDLGERESYLEVHKRTDLGPQIHPEAEVHPSAKVTNSAIGPQCQVGENAVIQNSVLWPGTEVLTDTHLDRCILYSSNPASGVHVNEDL